MSASKRQQTGQRKTAGSAKHRKARPRNPLVPVVRGLPMQVEDSAKRYKRHPKHRKRAEPGDA
ncbi:MAG: hypothetical protein R3316_09750 [Rhodovibrionaceae bacterium]|nr:hypothetical protein [Rhodovibrionaceae bacterium]